MSNTITTPNAGSWLLLGEDKLHSLRRNWTQEWATLQETDPDFRTVQWAIMVRIGNKDLRLSTGNVTFTDDQGVDYVYNGGLVEDLDVEETYSVGSPSMGARSMTMSIPNGLIDAMSIIQQGYPLAGRGEIAIGAPGMRYEERRVFLDGEITRGVRFGSLGGKVEFTISDARDRAGIPVTPFIIDETRHSAATTNAIGKSYPFVMGGFEHIPAPMVQGGSGARCVASVLAPGITAGSFSRVWVDGTSYSPGNATYGWEARQAKDGSGDGYWEIHFTGSNVFTGEESVEVEITGETATLHEVMAYLLTKYTTLGARRIHYGLIGEMRSRMGIVPIKMFANGFGSSSSTALQIIEDRICVSFPMITMGSLDGAYGPIVTDGRDPSRMTLTEGIELLNRESDFEESTDGVSNHFQIDFDYDIEGDQYRKTYTAAPDQHPQLLKSQVLLGDIYAATIQSTEITETWVASKVMEWLIYHMSMPYYTIEYEVPTWIAMKVRLGWNVLLNIPSLSLVGKKATVIGKRYNLRVSTMTFRIWWQEISRR